MNPWERIKQVLAAKISTAAFENWLSRTAFLKLDAGELCVGVPDEATRQWMEREYASKVWEAIQELRIAVRQVSYSLASPHGNGASKDQDIAFAPSTSLNPKYTFDSFVVGPCNQFAHAAAHAVATGPSKTYNPLFIYGGAGMGKTHLMHAIGRSLLDHYAGMRIVLTTSERFMNEMITCIKRDRMPLFHRHYRSADVLLIDDIHILAGREGTQEEFFHTFNELFEHQKQIIVSSDSPPKNVPGLVERLRSRFEWGLMVDVQPPDLETKMAILDKKAEQENVNLPENVRVFIATKTKSNVRELEGALIKLIAYSSVTGEAITLHLAQQVLKHLTHGPEKKLTIDSIIKAVAERHNLQPAQLKAKSNERKIAYPRQIAMYLTKDLTTASLPEIGRAFGGKHHTTVIHSINKIEQLRHRDPDLNSLINSLTDTIR